MATIRFERPIRSTTVRSSVLSISLERESRYELVATRSHFVLEHFLHLGFDRSLIASSRSGRVVRGFSDTVIHDHSTNHERILSGPTVQCGAFFSLPHRETNCVNVLLQTSCNFGKLSEMTSECSMKIRGNRLIPTRYSEDEGTNSLSRWLSIISSNDGSFFSFFFSPKELVLFMNSRWNNSTSVAPFFFLLSSITTT